MTTIADVHKACSEIVAHSNNAYAKAYAIACLRQRDSEAVAVQCMYVLNNLATWRGEYARSVKQVLKDYLQEQDI